MKAPEEVNQYWCMLCVGENKNLQTPQFKLPMESTNKDKRCSVHPLAHREGTALSPVPRMDSPLLAGGNLPQGTQTASCASKGSTKDSGKTNKPPRITHNSVPGSGVRETNLTNKDNLNIVHFNICGLSTKKDEFKHFLHVHKIHIALLQETQHVAETDINITGYTHYPCDCKDCQGAITYIRNDVTGKVTNINTTQPTILQNVEIWHAGSKYDIYNIYNPPINQLNLIPHFGDLQFTKTIIAGDFNGRSPAWGYTDHNPTGKFIETFCNITNLIRIQDHESPPTHFHRVHKTLNSPDLTLISADLMSKLTSEVTGGIGTSDHFPTVLKIRTPEKKKLKQWTRWNFKKAHWDDYKATSDRLLSEVDLNEPDVNNSTKAVTEAILTAAQQCIPRGCRAKYKPFWSKQLASTVQKREEARKKFMQTDSIENKIDFNRTSAVSKKEILAAKRNKFHTSCQDIDLSKEGTKAWSLLRNLNGENKKSNPKPLQDGEDTIADDQKRAERHNNFFATTNKAQKLTEEDKQMLNLLKLNEKAPTTSIKLFDDPFNTTELNKAMRKLKSRKSPGPDKIHNEMLTHLGDIGKKVILNIINKSWLKGEVPKAWKLATVKPLLKKGKSAEEVASYRPISLTSCLGKLAERMSNARLYWWLETNEIIDVHQAGFRTGQRTEDLLFRITQRVIDGFHDKKSTVGVFVDLQQAFDRVWRKGLLHKMREYGIHGNLYKWIKSFLTDRLIQTKVGNAFSSKKVLEEGLPQGSSLSCTLFLIFLNDLPKELKSEKGQYADDLSFWQTQNKVGTCAILLNEDLAKLERYCQKWKLKINYNKTVYTIFSKSSNEAKKKLTVQIGDKKITKEENPVYLGVKLDRQLTLSNFIEKLKQKATNRLKIVKRLASSKWGADKTNLRQMYLGYVRSTLEHNLAIQSICSPTLQQSLDKVQNEAVKFISGGMKSSPIAACEIDSNIEPLRLRREASVVEMVERYRRCDNDNPNKKIVDRWCSNEKIKQKSILKVEKELQEKHHLPVNRESDSPISKELPPNRRILKPIIKLELIEKVSKEKTDPVDLYNLGVKTTLSYPDDFNHVYTDGSAFKGTTNAGCGVRIEYSDKTCDELYKPCGVLCANYEAEALALHHALQKLKETFKNDPNKQANCVIFSDSLSVLSVLDEQNYTTKAIRDLSIQINSFLEEFNISLYLQWIPSHCGIPGNERADTLAKKGTTQNQPEKPISQSTAKQIIKSNSRIEWHNLWAQGDKGRVMFQYVPKPNRKDPINFLKRKDQVVIFRLRTNHIQLNAHLSRITKDHNPTCTLCGYKEETVHHFLFECPHLQDLRTQFLPLNPDRDNSLYSTKNQLTQTCRFFHEAILRRTKVRE